MMCILRADCATYRIHSKYSVPKLLFALVAAVLGVIRLYNISVCGGGGCSWYVILVVCNIIS